MQLKNTETHYGSVAKFFHWIVALGIITNIPLGLIANALPFGTSEELATKALAFSLHKTLGVSILMAALGRIAWAIYSPKPRSLNTDRKFEAFLAGTVYWVFYASLVLVPMTGWIAHAASEGFAPILWPFGQSLAFVPKAESVLHGAATLHIIFERLLIVALVLHTAGALKHHFVNRDVTLRRMLPGAVSVPEAPPKPRTLAPLGAALGVYLAAVAAGVWGGLFATDHARPTVAALAEKDSAWVVQAGSVALSVFELGNTTTGEFAQWTAAIDFSPDPVDGLHGKVEVDIAIGSLTLGSVTGVALGPEFFEANLFPTAQYTGPIVADGDGYAVDGVLTIKSLAQPVRLPFTLEMDGDTAHMTADVTVDRQDFNVGKDYLDPDQVGFEVGISIRLTATRAPD